MRFESDQEKIQWLEDQINSLKKENTKLKSNATRYFHKYLNVEAQEITPLRKQLGELTDSLERQKDINRRLVAENERLKRWLENPDDPERKKNPRNAGRKPHNEKWERAYNVYYACFEKNMTLKQAEEYVNNRVDRSEWLYGLKKFSKSTYYRYKKIYNEEQRNSTEN